MMSVLRSLLREGFESEQVGKLGRVKKR